MTTDSHKSVLRDTLHLVWTYHPVLQGSWPHTGLSMAAQTYLWWGSHLLPMHISLGPVTLSAVSQSESPKKVLQSDFWICFIMVWCSTLHFGDTLSCSQRTHSLHLWVRTSQNTEYQRQVISVYSIWPIEADMANVFANFGLFTHAANKATLICFVMFSVSWQIYNYHSPWNSALVLKNSWQKWLFVANAKRTCLKVSSLFDLWEYPIPLSVVGQKPSLLKL